MVGELQLVAVMRSTSPEPFKHTVRAKMAAQVDLLRAKVNDERIRDSYDRFIKEKKKKKRDFSPSADKIERCEKEAKKVKHHHHHLNHQQQQHAENRSHQPHQLQRNPKAQNFSPDKHVLHMHHHHNGHHQQALINGTKKSLQPAFPAQKRAVTHQPPALFTFTPLKVVKAQPQELKDKRREKEHKLKLKKENSEANVKHPELNKKKGEFICRGVFFGLLSTFSVIVFPDIKRVSSSL